MRELKKDEVREFLRGLSKLSRRYKISIGGCGCCGSPFLFPMSKDDGRYEVNDKDFDGLHWKTNESA